MNLDSIKVHQVHFIPFHSYLYLKSISPLKSWCMCLHVMHGILFSMKVSVYGKHGVEKGGKGV